MLPSCSRLLAVHDGVLAGPAVEALLDACAALQLRQHLQRQPRCSQTKVQTARKGSITRML
jgi:hypothetical protein